MTFRRAFVLGLATLSSIASSQRSEASCSEPRNEISSPVAVKTDDGFVVAWSYRFDGSSEGGIRAIKVDASGKSTGAKATHQTFEGSSASITLRANGNDATLAAIVREFEFSRVDHPGRSEVTVSAGPALGALARVATLPVALRGEGAGIATKDGFLLRLTGEGGQNDRLNELVALDQNGALVARSSHPGLDSGYVALGLGSNGVIASRYKDGSEPVLELYGVSNDGKTATCSGATCSPANPPVKMRVGPATATSRGGPGPLVAFAPTSDGAIVFASYVGGTDVAYVSSAWALTPNPALTAEGYPSAHKDRKGDVVVFLEDFSKRSAKVAIAPSGGTSIGTPTDAGARRAPLACNADVCIGLEFKDNKVLLHTLGDDLVPKSTETIETVQPVSIGPCNDSPEPVGVDCSFSPRTASSAAAFGLLLVASALVVLRRRTLRGA